MIVRGIPRESRSVPDSLQVKARAACPGFLLCALSLLKREFVLAMAMSETWKQQVVIDSRW